MYLPASSNLANLRGYKDKYVDADQPGAFEFLVAVAFHRIFCLPLQTKDTEDDSIKHRVIWYGQHDKIDNKIHKSPSGPDCFCFAYGVYILIECTLRGNSSNQWRKEFVESLKHYDDYARASGIKKDDFFLALVAPEFHKDTYTGFKQKVIEGYNIAMLDCASLAKISKTCESNTTFRHLDLRYLMKKIVSILKDSASLAAFRKDRNRWIAEWKIELLKQEKTVYFGLKSYEAMKRVGRNTVGVSDIMLELQKDRKINTYLQKLGGGDLSIYIRDGLLNERLARLVETPDEDLFRRVDGSDFKARGLRLIDAVERIDK